MEQPQPQSMTMFAEQTDSGFLLYVPVPEGAEPPPGNSVLISDKQGNRTVAVAQPVSRDQLPLMVEEMAGRGIQVNLQDAAGAVQAGEITLSPMDQAPAAPAQEAQAPPAAPPPAPPQGVQPGTPGSKLAELQQKLLGG